MQFRSSVESTRPLTGTSQITKWKRLWGTAGVVLLTLIASASASAGLPSTITIVSGNNQVGPPSATLPDPLTVEYRDGGGTLIAGGSLIYTVTSGDAVFVSNGGTSAIVSADGVGRAAQQVRFGSTPGAVTVRVTDFGSAAPAIFNLTATSGAVVPPLITYDPPAGSAFTLSADGGTAVGGISASPSGGSGTGTAATTTVNNCSFATNPAVFTVAGEPLVFEGATVTALSLSLTCQVAASEVTARLTCNETRGLAEPSPRFFDVTCPAAPPTVTIVSGDGQTGAPNTTLPNPIVAEFRDSAGTVIVDGLVHFRITSGDALLQPAGGSNPSFVVQVRTNSLGQAAVEMVLGAAEGPVVAEAGGDPDFVINAPFGATIAAAPSTLTIVSGDAQSGPPSTTAPLPIVAEYRNGAGYPIAGARLIVEIISGDAQVRDGVNPPATSISIFTDDLGRVSANLLFGATPGAVTGRAYPFVLPPRPGEPPQPGEALFTATVAGAPTLTITNGNNQTGQPGAALPVQLTVRLLDSAGSPINGASVIYTVTSGTASFAGQTSLTTSTNSSGEAFATLNLGGTPGPVTVTASSMGQTVTFNETIAIANIAPMVTFNPPAGSGLTLSASGSSASGSITATPSGGSGSGPAATTTVDNCTFATNPVSFTVAGQPLTFVGPDTTPQNLSLTCQVGPSAATARLTCRETSGAATPVAKFFDVTCPAAPAAPTLTITNGNNQTGQPGSTLPDPLTVRLLNGAGSPIFGESVFYTVTGGTASFAGQSSFITNTNASGQAFATLNLGGTPGPVTVTASSMGQTVTFNETIAIANIAPMVTFNPPAGSGLALSASGTSASGSITATPSGGSGSGPAATTTVDNCTFATNPVNFTVAGQPLTFVGPGTTPQSLSLACQIGPSAVTARLTCRETMGTVTPVTKFFDVTCPAAPGTPTLTIVGGNGQSGPPNSVLPSPVVAELRDAFGTPNGSATLQFSITSGNALIRRVGGSAFSPNVTISTNTQGQSAIDVQLGSVAGTVTGQVCEVFPAPNRGVSLCAPFTATIATPTGGSIQIVSGNNQAGDSGANSQPLRIQLVGSGVAGVPVTFTLVSGSGALLDANGNPASQVVVNSDPGGTASVVFRYGSTPGPVRIRAEAQGFGSVVFDLTVIDPTAGDSLRIVSGDGQSGASGTRSAPLIVELRRRSAPSPGETISWFVRIGDAQLDNSSTTTGTDGRSTNFITFGQTQGPVVIEARSSDGRLVVQFTLNTLAPAALNIRLVSGGGQSGPINSAFAAPLVFEVTNSQGQLQSGVLVSFAVTQGSATLDANTATTDAQGRASVSGRYGPNAGPIQVRASIGSGPTLQTAIADLTAFAPGLRIVSGDNQSALVGTTLPAPLVVELTRPAGSAGSIAGIVLRWTVIEGGGRVTNATTTTDAAGRASNTFALGPNAGANRVRVDADGGGTVTFVATATAPPPAPTARVEIVSGNNQNLPTNTDSAPLVVRVFNGATLVSFPNVCVTFSSLTPGVTVSPAQVNSDANGRAQTIARLADVGPAIVSARVCNATSDQVNFALNGAIANTLGLDPDDRAFPIAQAFDNACAALRTLRSGGATLNAGQADLLARCDDLEFSAGNDPDGVVDALEEILSDEAEAQNTAALTIAAAQFDNLKARIAALRSGTNGASFGGLALQGSNGAVPLSFASSALNGSANASATDGQPAPAEAGIDFDRWGFFATGTIGDGDRDPGGGSTGFDFETRGLTAGVDYRYNDSLIFGAAVGYASNDTDIGSGAGELESTGLSISGYSTFYKGDSWYADGVLTYGSNQYDITRNVEFTLTTPSGNASTVDQVNTASPDGSQFSAAFTAGRDFQRGAWGFGPFLRWQYTSVDFDGYSETVSNPNAPGLGLTVAVNQRKVKSMQGVLGGKATYTMSTAWGILIPHFQFEYVREFKSDPDALISRLVFDPTGTQIAVAGSDVDQSFMNLGLGVSAIFANGRSAFMYYEKLLGQEGTSKDSLAIGIRIEF